MGRARDSENTGGHSWVSFLAPMDTAGKEYRGPIKGRAGGWQAPVTHGATSGSGIGARIQGLSIPDEGGGMEECFQVCSTFSPQPSPKFPLTSPPPQHQAPAFIEEKQPHFQNSAGHSKRSRQHSHSENPGFVGKYYSLCSLINI